MDSQLAQRRQQARQAFDRQDYQTALVLFQAIAEKHPNFADIRHYAGLCQSFLGNPEAALQEFDYALAANPGYVEAHINRALTLNELGRFDEASDAFEQAGHYEQDAPGDFPAAVTARLANAHSALGDLYVDAGAPAEAAVQFRRALDLRPRFHDIRNKLAYALLQLGESEQAAAELRRVLDANPQFLGARMTLGLAYYRLGHVDRAKREWEISLAQDPENPQVRAYLAMLGRASERAASSAPSERLQDAT